MHINHKWPKRESISRLIPYRLYNQTNVPLTILIRQATIFRSAGASIVGTAAEKLEESHFTPGDVIFQSGGIAEAMYFVMHGEAVAIGNSAENVLSTYRPGDHFGEMGILFTTVWTHTVLAGKNESQMSIIFSISSDAAAALARTFPEWGIELKVQKARSQKVALASLNAVVSI